MRDYKTYPLKTRELIPEEDLYELFIIQNLSAEEIAEILNISKHRVNNCANKYKFYKTAEQKKQVKEKLSLKKYGTPHYFNTNEFKQKKKETCLKKYGTDNFANLIEVKEKRKKTCIERYGVDNPNKLQIFKEKGKQTCLEKYGVDSHNKSSLCKDKQQQTLLEKYGVTNISKLEEIKEKKKETFNEHFNTPEKLEEIKIKTQTTNIEKYGAKTFAESIYCNHSENQQKRDYTLQLNQTYNKSKPEDIIFNILNEKFSVKRNYKTLLYPFRCDFYVVDLDLYIEFNGHISHGKHPFNPQNKDDMNQLNIWEQRANELNYKNKPKKAYKNFIETWTKRDPEKRLIAKQNNLNWLEFFTLNEFLTWFNNLEKLI